MVTGCAGFIGSWISQTLVERGHVVRGLDNFETGKRRNIAILAGDSAAANCGTSGSFEFIECDLREPEPTARACQGVDLIFHEAAIASVPRSIREPRTSHTANVDGTFNLLEGARAAGVKRIIYAASSSAYGNQLRLPQREDMLPAPLSPYAAQKLSAELYLRSYWEVFNIETICLRYFNIFGPRQDPHSPYSGVIAKFIRQMMYGKQPTINGDGEQSRDFTYIENAVSANLLAMEAPAEKVGGRVFNIACGGRQTLNQTFQILAELLEFKQPPIYGPAFDGDIRNSLADISAAREAFGYEPIVGFEEGLRRTISWYHEEYALTSA